MGNLGCFKVPYSTLYIGIAKVQAGPSMPPSAVVVVARLLGICAK